MAQWHVIFRPLAGCWLVIGMVQTGEAKTALDLIARRYGFASTVELFAVPRDRLARSVHPWEKFTVPQLDQLILPPRC